jgi:nicotinamidase-related amidase
MKFFIVIDMQNGFTTGSLANPAAQEIIPRIKEEIEKARKEGATIVYTRDTHQENYLETGEGKHLPIKHCVEGTDDWQIVDELKPGDDDVIINKEHFGYAAWADYIEPGDEVTMVGTCTDICVISNALAIKMIENVEVNILAGACAGLAPATHKAALEVMRCCQCNILE